MNPSICILFFLLGVRLVESLTLQSSTLSVGVDSIFPRPLSYTLLSTNETLGGSLTGFGFHLHLSLNRGKVTCGEAGISTQYTLINASVATFSTTAACTLNWGNGSPSTLSLLLAGSVSAVDDAVVTDAGIFTLTISDAVLTGPSAPLLSEINVGGLELLSLRGAPDVSTCMYTATDNGKVPKCSGDYYFVDSWINDGLDEWYSFTWDQSWIVGQVDANTPAGGNIACSDSAAMMRQAPGPMASVFAGGWSASQKTGAAVLSNAHHAPFRTGLRSHDAPGRCSVFSIAPAPLQASFDCGSALPIILRVGVFPDVTQDGTVSGDDIALWRRAQFPRADVLYRSTLPYKIQIDLTAYQPSWTRLPFVQVLDYISNISKITDSYPQTPILVGWQGLGHDTLYPSLDVLNVHADVGGRAGLDTLNAGIVSVSGTSLSSLSYHVNSDEAYSLFNSLPNPAFDPIMCRVNIDHVTPWAMNCSVDGQTPNCGIRCSISKTKDAANFGRYNRLQRFFDVVQPVGLRTIHSDAWRDVDSSWEEPPTDASSDSGYIDSASEAYCGQMGDVDFWGSHGASMGGEGNDGTAFEFLGAMSFLYHGGPAWDTTSWGRIVSGTALGWDLDVYCNNPGGRCTWNDMSDNFWLVGKLYQLALTEELLGTDETGWHRFGNGGHVHRSHHHYPPAQSKYENPVPRPSVWPFGGDSIPIVNGKGGVLMPLIIPSGESTSLSPNVLHAYQSSSSAQPPVDPSCALFNASRCTGGADNTAVGNYASADVWVNYEATLSSLEAAERCNASCWSNASCTAWNLIKVTPASGRVVPTCGIFTTALPVGCTADPNQFAGTKLPLPLPPSPDATITQSWTLPLFWVGKNISVTELTPTGPVVGSVEILINGRNLTLTGMTPAWAVRIETQ